MFTKSGLFTIFTVILLHNSNKVVSSNEFTKSGLFTIFTFTKSGVDCNMQKVLFLVGFMVDEYLQFLPEKMSHHCPFCSSDQIADASHLILLH